MSSISWNRNLAFWALNAGGWSVLGLLDKLINFKHAGSLFDLFLLAAFAAGFLVCIPLRYVYRFAIPRLRRGPGIALLVLGLSFVAANVWSLAAQSLYELFGFDKPGAVDGLAQFTRFDTYVYEVMWNKMWPILVWSVLYLAITMWLESRMQKDRAERAETLAQKAQLEMLRYQMNPHFLFNSLNSIRAMINEDSNAARAMISDLADFLRYSLLSRDQPEVPLRKEVAAVERYLAIEKRRYEDRLEVVISVAPEAEEILVPCFVVHPLVENAVKHGMRTSTMPLRLRLNCEYSDNELRITVANTGSLDHERAGETKGTGTGLRNVTERLKTLYSDHHHFSLSEEAGWVVARITIRGLAKGAQR